MLKGWLLGILDGDWCRRHIPSLTVLQVRVNFTVRLVVALLVALAGSAGCADAARGGFFFGRFPRRAPSRIIPRGASRECSPRGALSSRRVEDVLPTCVEEVRPLRLTPRKYSLDTRAEDV